MSFRLLSSTEAAAMPPEPAAELAAVPTAEPLTITLSPELSERIRTDIALHGYPNPLAVV